MTVLFLSTRRDGRSLGDMVRSEMGPVAGAIALNEAYCRLPSARSW
jgi:carbon starvation protein CstA